MLENYKNESFDVIIQAGQSNSEGCGLRLAEEEYVPNENVLYMQSDFTIIMAQEMLWQGYRVNNLALSFSGEYIKSGRLQNGRKILILRAAVGGTGWANKRWGMNDDLYLRMTAMIKTALGLNPANRLVALLWHQGETEIELNTSHKNHYNNLKTLVESVRNVYNYPNLPFIAGDFVNEWKTANFKTAEPFALAIKDVCDDIGYAAFVETAELTSNNKYFNNGDDIHFSWEALDKLGIKYFNAFAEI